MKHWPLSVVAQSPSMPAAFLPEFRQVYATCYLSWGAFHACGIVADHTPPREAPNLTIVRSVGAPARRVYTDYPTWEEWSQLERGGVFEHCNELIVLVDGLH